MIVPELILNGFHGSRIDLQQPFETWKERHGRRWWQAELRWETIRDWCKERGIESRRVPGSRSWRFRNGFGFASWRISVARFSCSPDPRYDGPIWRCRCYDALQLTLLLEAWLGTINE